ncbi:MAG TPA: O-antigen ligase family protein [Terriglobia bacterium]|nr:O-antigen ligase family protein [Terriglobia bacterium]
MKNPNPFAPLDRAGLPPEPLARWASIFFTFSIATLLLSVAASQSFLALSGLCYAAHLLSRPAAPAFLPIKLPLALFCLTTVLSIFWSENPAASGFVIKKLVLFVILILTVNLMTSARQLAWAFKAIFVDAALAGVWGAVEFVRQLHQVRLLHPARVYTFMTVQRITGFMGHWMNFGGQQMLALAALLAFLLFHGSGTKGDNARSRSAAPGVLWVVIAVVVTFSILLNFTRGVWLASTLAVIYLVARWRVRWLWLLPVLGAILIFASPRLLRSRLDSVFHPGAHPSEAIRLEMWRVGFRMIRQHPLVGVGPGNIIEMYPLYMPPGKTPMVGYHDHLHNDYVQFAAERGIPCLLAWLWMMMALGIHNLRLCKKLGPLRWVAQASFAAWIALLAEGLFEFNFGSTPVLAVYLFLAAAPFAAERIETLEKRG